MSVRDPSRIISRCQSIRHVYQQILSEIEFLSHTINSLESERRRVIGTRLGVSDERERWALGQELNQLGNQIDHTKHKRQVLKQRLQEVDNQYDFEDCASLTG